MNKYLTATIKENSRINGSNNLLALYIKDTSENPVPGQFYMLEVSSSYDPLLKRPLSIFRKINNELQFLYRIKGKGTEKLQKMREGTNISIIGPLGNGYPLPSEKQIPLLIAGGVGVASIFSLAEKLDKKAYVFYGGRNKDELVMKDEIRNFAKELFISTDDGSEGEKGTVIDILNKFLDSQGSMESLVIYVCGPLPMLRAVAEVAVNKKIAGYISAEENMACGIGACLGCVIKTKHNYKRVCREGPVFSIHEIIWE
ncbi:MAG: dihydroorotate dehydrogenase electron transfer subunit [Nitrospiraceae bacterium]|nr:dihydroorotate dehydrogenase electron transfer subunit [Nitrospiraceae bacterium]